jgi:hypothetical protein
MLTVGLVCTMLSTLVYNGLTSDHRGDMWTQRVVSSTEELSLPIGVWRFPGSLLRVFYWLSPLAARVNWHRPSRFF